MPIARRMAFAIFRWLTGLRPVNLLPLMRPELVVYSEIMEKFCDDEISVDPGLVVAVMIETGPDMRAHHSSSSLASPPTSSTRKPHHNVPCSDPTDSNPTSQTHPSSAASASST